MFGRRRHAASVAAAEPVAPATVHPVTLAAVMPAPQLSEGQIFDIVHAQLDALLGDKGLWAVVPRGAGDTDSIFQSVLTRSFAVGVTQAIQDGRRRLEATSEAPQVAEQAEVILEPAARELSAAEIALAEPFAVEQESTNIGESIDLDEPAAFRWEPAPITVWTDLKKPVTGPLAQVTPAVAPAAPTAPSTLVA
jgi:hypothetical protein